jgi:RNA polymerase sigma-70 factor (ECF subfamily)
VRIRAFNDHLAPREDCVNAYADALASRELLSARAALTEGLAALRTALGLELMHALTGGTPHVRGASHRPNAPLEVSRTRTRGQGNDAATRHQPGSNTKVAGGRIRPGAPIPGQATGASETIELPPVEAPEQAGTGAGGAPAPYPDRPDPSDAAAEVWALVERAQAGDADAFGKIYDRYVDTVFRFVYFRVGNRQLAEDLTADTFLRALKRIGSFTWQGRDLGAWLVTIARNLVADHFKSGRYRLEVTTGDVLDADTAERGPEGSPEAAVVDHITNVALLTAVKQLNPEQQECIVLRFLQGFSVAETAQAMGKNEGAIKALQYRAVRALARLLPDGFHA